MNTEPILVRQPPLIKIHRPSRRLHIPHLLGWLFAAFMGFVLVGLSLPCTGSVQVKGSQTKALAQAKQIGLALRLFAGDHDGKYPRQGVPQEMTAAPADSNTAFACLFPTYTESEIIFGNKLSGYQTVRPDNVIDRPYTGTPKETLQPGENVYSYVMGLTDADNPALPLVADGTDGTGHYRRDPRSLGGVWGGTRAVVIRLDNSGALETLVGPEDASFVPNRLVPAAGHAASATSLFDFSGLDHPVRLLNPAVGPRRR